MHRPILHKPVVNQYREAADAVTGVDVAPPVANEIACPKVDVVFASCLEDHARLRLAARAIVRVGMVADLDFVDWQATSQFLMHGIYGCARRYSRGNVGLIRYDDGEESRITNAAYGIFDSGQQLEF